MRRARGRSGSGVAAARRGLLGNGAGPGEGRKRGGGGWRARRRGRRREVAQEEQSESMEDAIAARILGARSCGGDGGGSGGEVFADAAVAAQKERSGEKVVGTGLWSSDLNPNFAQV